MIASLAPIARLALFSLTGLVVGVAHFRGLRRDVVARLARDRGAIAAHVVRSAATVAVLVFVARYGPLPACAAFAGFFVARSWVARSVARGIA